MSILSRVMVLKSLICLGVTSVLLVTVGFLNLGYKPRPELSPSCLLCRGSMAEPYVYFDFDSRVRTVWFLVSHFAPFSSSVMFISSIFFEISIPDNMLVLAIYAAPLFLFLLATGGASISVTDNVAPP